MGRPQKPHNLPPTADDDSVRIIRRKAPGGRWRRWAFLLVLGLAIGGGAGYLYHMTQTSPADHAAQEQRNALAAATAFASPRARTTAPPRAVRPSPPKVHAPEPPDDAELISQDPNELSGYIPPGAPAPTMAEVIEALHEAGIHEGLGAFNPPGTSPPLQGLVVPDDFELPEGYVRHHQVTDEGEPIEPILMFSPDYEFYDESGNRVEIPPDRVVPPEQAPPGMPIVQVQIPET